MTFYDCYGNEKCFDTLTSLSSGECGEVYFYNPEELLKIYYETCSSNSRLEKYVYDITKELNSPHIVDIKDLLFDKKIEGIYFDENHIFKTNPIDAYTCNYIKPDNIDILTMPTDYTLENMYEISKILSYYASKRIFADDMKAANTILQNDRIIIIDIDCFRKTNHEEVILNYMNQQMITSLLKGLFLNCIDVKNDDSKESVQYKFAICQLFYEFDFLTLEDDKFKLVNEYFSKYKYPIDAIKEYKKNRF